MIDARYYQNLLKKIVEGRKFIIAVGSLSDAIPWARALTHLGALPPFLLVDSIGTEEAPETVIFDWEIVCGSSNSVIGSLRNYAESLKQLSRYTRRRLDDFDPKHEAIAIAEPFLDVMEIAGRRVLAPPNTIWRSLEDKTQIDSFWDSAGIAHPPSRIVRTNSLAELRKANIDYDEGFGTVWAGDSREGCNGGATYVRWLSSEADQREIEEFFIRHCDLVRIAPFVEGIPCSIHGIVFPSSVVVFHPVELVVLRRGSNPRLFYAGAGTFWYSSEAQMREIRELAFKTGSLLQSELGYLGAFNIDGILTHGGFLATEMNTRFAAGLHLLSASTPDIPLALLEMVVRCGMPLDYYPEDLQRLVMVSRGSFGQAYVRVLTEKSFTRGKRFSVVFDGQHADVTNQSGSAEAMILTGQSQVGGIVIIRFGPRRMQAKGFVSEKAASALALADRILGTTFGFLSTAPGLQGSEL